MNNAPQDSAVIKASNTQTVEVVQIQHAFVDHTTMPGIGRVFPMARLVSLAVLALLVVGLFHAGRATYYLLTDRQIAPFVLTPESDAITSSRLSLTSLTTEREAAAAHREVLEQQLTVTRESLQRLRQLHRKVQGTLGVVYQVTTQSERSSQEELQKLLDQKAVIDVALADQQSHIAEISQRVQSGLAHGTDLVREQAELRRLTLLQLQRERDEVTAQNRLRELGFQTASREPSGKATPEVLRLEEQLLRMELELRRLEADEHGKLAELAAANAQAQRLDELITHLKARPLYRAIAKRQTLAFIPYTQLRGLDTNASIYECKLWSVFFCEPAGRIAEVLPGEINAYDPWGAPARGQYAVLELTESHAMMAKSLRVRAADAVSAASLWARLTHGEPQRAR
jgi:hypothetical protein